ncbi:hypothetical protein RclHR1_05720006 [Rhizophagus clarus]|uniref:Uncharacterized protein n=1 Tax=Rhizophagus clarus TaxID=94130 RepID=A0A2Z6RUM0_9GLOM|nr:hypothetical protein RclHR1_05720006 [Rhizophagus clarus]
MQKLKYLCSPNRSISSPVTHLSRFKHWNNPLIKPFLPTRKSIRRRLKNRTTKDTDSPLLKKLNSITPYNLNNLTPSDKTLTEDFDIFQKDNIIPETPTPLDELHLSTLNIEFGALIPPAPFDHDNLDRRYIVMYRRHSTPLPLSRLPIRANKRKALLLDRIEDTRASKRVMC